jgi:hypothetical protein
MTREEMPIFTRSFDLLSFLPATRHFPRSHRHDFTRRMLDAAFDLRERLEEANLRQGRLRRERLFEADEALARLRVYLRLASRRRLKRRKGIQFRRRLREAVEAYRSGKTPLSGLKSTVDGWLNHVRHANTTGLQKIVLEDPELQAALEDSRSPPFAVQSL